MKEKFMTVHKPRIVCAAIKHPSTKEIAVGVNHFCPIMRQNINGLIAERRVEGSNTIGTYSAMWYQGEQGFIDQHGKFYDREEAWAIADTNGQIIGDKDWRAGFLHPEHLY
jgi:hypothetical protein